jgi:hypothetical protein
VLAVLQTAGEFSSSSQGGAALAPGWGLSGFQPVAGDAFGLKRGRLAATGPSSKRRVVLAHSNGQDRDDQYHFVAIFAPQSPQCAHLYAPTSRVYADFPLHLHPGKSSWNTEEYNKILPAIEEIKLHIGSNRRASDTWIRCKVDWAVLAKCLAL